MNDPSWAHLIPTRFTPTALNFWNGRPVQFLLPAVDGSALLWWEFDVRDNDAVVGVIVHLTDDEAQRVFSTPPTVGLLEHVRSTLIDTEAAVFVFSEGSSAHRMIEIPRTGSEEEFIDYLFAESDQIRLGGDKDELVHQLAGAGAA
ncbi:MAG: hypothetical protein U1D00_13030 [Mycobacterium sp.]|nr:hypothetical protein [Mycobacterium sp.]